ncbi:hypothetical protein QS257_20965 [Terrilactibacillus sp. S3-3]|nr:hypothetical protein QS257_20965 [Terrilactibacillus sp. S3-3]
MKVLFIRSGYDGIYRFLEEWLIRSWQKAGCRLKVISHTEPDFFLIEELSDFDAIFTFLGDHLTDAAIVKLSQCAAPFIIWLTEDPFNIDQSLMLIERADIILTVDRGAYDFFISPKAIAMSIIFHLAPILPYSNLCPNSVTVSPIVFLSDFLTAPESSLFCTYWII